MLKILLGSINSRASESRRLTDDFLSLVLGPVRLMLMLSLLFLK
jgi:hypothetical protein